MSDITLYGLANECPYNARQDNCQLKDIEQLLFKQNVLYINGLNEEEKVIILKHHKTCSIKR